MSDTESQASVSWESAGREAFRVLDRYFANDDDLPATAPERDPHTILTELFDLLTTTWEANRGDQDTPRGATEGIDYGDGYDQEVI